MKKVLIILQFMFLLGMLSGCQKEETKEIKTLAIEPELFQYKGTEEIASIAVDDKGLLYTVTYIEPSDKQQEMTQRFHVYDLDGTCIQQKDIVLGSTRMHTMTLEGTTLYCVVKKSGAEFTLYTIDVTTWEVTELASLEDFSGMNKIVPIGDYIYLLGPSEIAEDKGYMLHPTVHSYYYTGEMVGRISRTEENPEVQFFNIDFPIDMFETKEGNLVIYQYTEENGFGFIEFDTKNETLQEVGWKESSTAHMSFSSCEDGYLFLKNWVLHYGTVDGMEAQITSDKALVGTTPAYVNGFSFYYDFMDNIVERVCITDVLKENKEIRMLINSLDTTYMYGCGYRMKKQEVDMDTFSLKVLAQDSDFDLYLLKSSDANAYNIKKNGAFYPLNEVEGVQEYLDACFPYLKEVATNEDGDIWMLPIETRIPGIFYDKEYCVSQGVDFSTMDYEEFLVFTEKIELQTPEKINNVHAITEFFAQYLSVESSFDTELFRKNAKQLKSLYEKIGENKFYHIMPTHVNGVLQGELPQFFYEYMAFSRDLVEYTKNVEDLGVVDKVGMMGIPKITEGLVNVGTCAFFAVNPQSENLEATLEYLSTLCTYLMQQQDSFLLSDESMYSDNAFMKECYEVYANGGIYFAMDSEIYSNVFQEYLEGKIELEDMIKEIERKREIYMKE